MYLQQPEFIRTTNLLIQKDVESRAELAAQSRQYSEEDLHRMMSSKTEYGELYSALKAFPLAVSADTGRLLYSLVRSTNARLVVEFGTSFGLSTQYIAAGLHDNGGGQVITTEFEAEKAAIAQQYLHDTSLSELVEIRLGDALQTLTHPFATPIDLVLLDGAKGLYLDILQTLTPSLRIGAIVLADDADYSADFLAHVRDPSSGFVANRLVEGLEMAVYVGKNSKSI